MTNLWVKYFKWSFSIAMNDNNLNANTRKK